MAIHVPPGTLLPDLEHCPPLQDQSRQRAAAGAMSGQWRSVLESVRSLFRHKPLLLWMAGLGMVAAMISSALHPRIYQSHASIQIQGVNENFLNLREIYPTAAPSADNAVYVQTQAEMLRQDALIEQVVRKLHLDERTEFLGGDWLGPSPSSPTPDTSRAVERIKKDLQILPSRGSSIIQIVCDARDARLAAEVANTLAQTFIDQSIEARQHAAKQTEVALSLELEQLRNKIHESQMELKAYVTKFGGIWGGGATTYDTLKPELEANRQYYQVLSRRIDEARLASAVNQSNIRLIGPAQPATHHYKPNLVLSLLVGAFGGLALGIGYVMLREQTDSALRAPGELGAYLTIPELGVIPKAGDRGFAARHLRNWTLRTTPVERASLEQPASGVSEFFRATLASIFASSRNGDRPRILLITSSCPLEGKTTVVSNLGVILAEIGNKVLLIDGDLRHPRLHKIFDQANSWGLSDLLQEKNAVEELPLEGLVKGTLVPRVYLLPSGPATDSLFALLWSGRMARLLARFREEFDYVLIDAPPCLDFADARIMGRDVEKVLFVVRADCTQKKTAQTAVERLLLDGIPVMGVILNCWDPSRSNTLDYAHRRQDLA